MESSLCQDFGHLWALNGIGFNYTHESEVRTSEFVVVEEH